MFNNGHLLFPNYYFLFLSLSTAFSQSFNVKPYLQNATSTSIHIMWESTDGEETMVEWGESLNLGFTTSGIAETSIDGYQIHDVYLENLSENTRYYYKVLTGNLESDIYDFVTPTIPGNDASLRIVAISDMQKDWSNLNKFEEIVSDGIIGYLSEGENPLISDMLDLILIPGDLVENGLEHSQWGDHFFEPSEPLFSHVPFYPVLGNHENNSPYFFSYFNLPSNGTPGYLEHWWYADFSNVRIIGLDSNWDFQLTIQYQYQHLWFSLINYICSKLMQLLYQPKEQN